ncbi:MAG: GNAT family N-acetyltransferase [Trinickia sp.]|jgi:putative acetyltransferase|uniref:GNAT family N-acetyltransferase n=1 Tax=Trinickia sp. TaxID=2571163 RepID=UPI003F810CB4
MNVALEPAKQPEVQALIDQLDAYQWPLYPPESHHGIDIDALSQPNVLFAVARDDAGKAIGCGAIVLDAEYGELKRVYTLPECRGKGVAKAILSLLEQSAGQRGCTRFVLETGCRQPDAITFYERSGYRRRGPFGSYMGDPNSVFMEKLVNAQPR